VNPRLRGLGETVLRVRDRARMRAFYTEVIGLEIMHEIPGYTFLRIAAGHGGHTQILALFEASVPTPFADARRAEVQVEHTSLHHFALEIDRADHDAELARLRGLGVDVVTAEHAWCHWRSIYARDPEGNVVELVCYDERAGG
jgi:catechol 2,3-dioxygenase-like lactoylglutathione lyase family enzyme